MNKEEQDEDDIKEVTPKQTKKYDSCRKETQIIVVMYRKLFLRRKVLTSPLKYLHLLCISNVYQKLSHFEKRGRRIAEKRINDILFGIEMAVDTPVDHQKQNQFFQFNFQAVPPTMMQGHSFIDMLNK